MYSKFILICVLCQLPVSWRRCVFCCLQQVQWQKQLSMLQRKLKRKAKNCLHKLNLMSVNCFICIVSFMLPSYFSITLLTSFVRWCSYRIKQTVLILCHYYQFLEFLVVLCCSYIRIAGWYFYRLEAHSWRWTTIVSPQGFLDYFGKHTVN